MDLILDMQGIMFLTVSHFPFLGVSAVFVSLRSFGDCPLGDVSLYEVLRCVRGGYGRHTVLYCLVVSGLPFWPFSGSGGLMLLGMVVAPDGRVRGTWVTSGWGLGGVFVLNWGGRGGQVPRCSLLEALGRCRLPHRFVVWCVFPRRVWLLFRFGWCMDGACLGPVVYLS